MAPIGGVDRELVRSWLTARSIARGLPEPVAVFGGFRVDTRSSMEVCRWVFATADPGLHELVRSIREPRRFVKLFGTAEELAALVPTDWTVAGGNWLMASDSVSPPLEPLPCGYRIEQFRNGSTTRVEIRTDAGELAAGGYAAETQDSFVYDRIETEAAHRRRGLARAVMAALGECRSSQSARQLLVATAEGEKLYSALGWRRLSPYSTACHPELPRAGPSLR
jgi:hypothetical protein